jgi:hypothetical protein
MSRGRFIGLVVAAVLAISAALFLSTHRNAGEREMRDSPLFPSLAGELGTATSLDIRKGAPTPTVTLHKKGEQWTVAQRGDYPADVPKLRKLLLALSDAKIIEEKTSDPANYGLIGVGDPTAATAIGTQVTFAVQDGTHSVIVGKPSGEGNFVRRGDEKASYLVAPGIYVESEPRYWIESKLLDIPAQDIMRIDYKPVAGAPYSVHRIVEAPVTQPAAPQGSAASKSSAAPAASAGKPPSPEAASEVDKGFSLEGAPAGRKAADAQTLAPSPAVFGSVTADDVAAAASIDFSKPFTAVLTLKDGSVITLAGTVVGDKHWIEVSAPKNDALSTRAAGRAFEVAGYRYDGFFRPLEQLLVPKETPPTAGKPQAAAQSSGSSAKARSTKAPAQPAPQ